MSRPYLCPLPDPECWEVRRAQHNLGGHAPACYGLPFRYWEAVPRNVAGDLRGIVRRVSARTAMAAARQVLAAI